MTDRLSEVDKVLLQIKLERNREEHDPQNRPSKMLTRVEACRVRSRNKQSMARMRVYRLAGLAARFVRGTGHCRPHLKLATSQARKLGLFLRYAPWLYR